MAMALQAAPAAIEAKKMTCDGTRPDQDRRQHGDVRRIADIARQRADAEQAESDHPGRERQRVEGAGERDARTA